MPKYNFLFVMITVGLCSAHVDAEIYRWDNREVIPGTEGIEPGPGVPMSGLNLQYADLRSLDLSRASFESSRLDQANFTDSVLVDAVFVDAVVTGANFWLTTRHGFTQQQLQSTRSYSEKNLKGMVFGNSGFAAGMLFPNNDLRGWDFHGQDLTGAELGHTVLDLADLTEANLALADFNSAVIRDANLSRANLKGADFWNVSSYQTAQLEGVSYDQWTQNPPDFEPLNWNWAFEPSSPGDFDGNGILDAVDLELLAFGVESVFPSRHQNIGALGDAFDLDASGWVDELDRYIWIHDLKQTYFGDANLDGEFNSGDLVAVFAAGEYTDDLTYNSGWASGDWDGDGDFTSSDVMLAFQDGGYELGPRVAANAVPEPASFVMLVAGLIGIAIRRRSVSHQLVGRLL